MEYLSNYYYENGCLPRKHPDKEEWIERYNKYSRSPYGIRINNTLKDRFG